MLRMTIESKQGAYGVLGMSNNAMWEIHRLMLNNDYIT